MKEKIKNYISFLNYYFKYLLDFKNLNKYIYLSSLFLNRVEKLLSSNMSRDVILDNIEISYSDFKVDYDDLDFSSCVNVDNRFNK